MKPYSAKLNTPSSGANSGHGLGGELNQVNNRIFIKEDSASNGRSSGI